MKKLFIAATLAFVAAVTKFATSRNANAEIRGDGELITHNIQARNFTGLYLNGGHQLTLRQSPEFSVKLEIQENLLEYLETSVKDETLHIGYSKNFNTSKMPTLSVTAPHINALNLMGATYGDITLDTSVLNINTGGAGTITLSGRAENISITTAGSSDIDAFGMEAANATINVAGMGNINIHATNTLSINMSGMGRVRYKGEPQLTQHVDGMGIVENYKG